ncbi:hypothetical protein [Clostridium intestinale]|uniref:hypothetical protein n=1 Tax=Clostridium intestinale TaxID=36845 RepID=UPI0028ED4053|nr:hypothetical protein [Clostridium intestinale]
MGKVIYLNDYRKDKLETEVQELTLEEQYIKAEKQILKEYSSLEEYYKQLYK